MTRINAFIPVEELNNKMLIAEHREIKRIPNQIKKGKYKLENIPDKFTLGTGHVKFFYTKLSFLLKRYIKIHDECKKRGFNVSDYSSTWFDLPFCLMNDWCVDEEEKTRIQGLIRDRINLRLNK